jgi:predicted phage replisome organizer
LADNKKYYYLKLKENFFESDTMIILESMPDGYLYSNILMKLYLRSLKNEGKLMFNDKIPYNPTILAQVTRHSVGVIEKAIKIFKDLDLIDILDNGAIYMLDIQNFIGESSTEADRKRAYRNRIESEKLLTSGQMSGQISDKSTPEIEIDIEKEIKKDIYSGASPRKHTFKPPTLEEVQAYCKERNNNVDAERWYNFYTSKGWMIGKNKMKDWKAAVRTWEKQDKPQQPQQQKKNGFNNFTGRTYDPKALEAACLEKSKNDGL